MSSTELFQELQHPGRIAKFYSPKEETPLGSYAALIGGFFLLLTTLETTASKSSETREKFNLADFAILLPAIHKISRIITKDWVTAPIRAPFVEFQSNAGAGEVKESSRGTGIQKALGDLLTCQYCIGPWVSTLMVYGMTFMPRQARRFATIFALVAGSDFLHLTYQGFRKAQKLEA